MQKDNEQTEFWRGDFGDEYINRNLPEEKNIRSRINMWAEIFSNIYIRPKNILEVGANIGLNLRALKFITDSELFAVEPNASARDVLVKDKVVLEHNVFDGIAASLPFDNATMEMVFTSGVLIHVNPEQLLESVKEINRVSSKYIVCIEYFSMNPETIPYREHAEKLFKRDFGSFYMETLPNLQLINYGFFWKKVTGLDNLTWWLFEKK